MHRESGNNKWSDAHESPKLNTEVVQKKWKEIEQRNGCREAETRTISISISISSFQRRISVGALSTRGGWEIFFSSPESDAKTAYVTYAGAHTTFQSNEQTREKANETVKETMGLASKSPMYGLLILNFSMVSSL